MRHALEEGTVRGGEDAGASAHREPPRTGTLAPRTGALGLIARAAAHDRISAALRRDARARAASSEHEVVDLMRARGVSITRATLERWERTGGIRLEEAVDLAAVYHMTHRRARGPPRLAQPLPRHDGSRAARLGLMY